MYMLSHVHKDMQSMCKFKILVYKSYLPIGRDEVLLVSIVIIAHTYAKTLVRMNSFILTTFLCRGYPEFSQIT